MGDSAVTVFFVEKTVLSSLNGLATPVESADPNCEVYFWTLIAILLLYISILMSIPHIWITVVLEIRKYESSSFVPSAPQGFFGFMNFESSSSVSTKTPGRIRIETLLLNLQIVFGGLQFLYYIIFQSVCMGYFSIYLDFL